MQENRKTSQSTGRQEPLLRCPSAAIPAASGLGVRFPLHEIWNHRLFKGIVARVIDRALDSGYRSICANLELFQDSPSSDTPQGFDRFSTVHLYAYPQPDARCPAPV